ncbi:hypothetical protein TNCV_3526111 [Trichonephila clavipes]|nr:hypothetical protein TNCV_3526111 [Trichonephila clavipes]
MPLSRMENTTFAMPSIIDSHDMGLRTVYSPDAQKKTPIQRLWRRTSLFGTSIKAVFEDIALPNEKCCTSVCIFTSELLQLLGERVFIDK